MSDPPRLLGRESGADELERALVDSLRGPGPDAHQKAAMFAALAAQIGAAGGAIATSSAAAQASGVGAQTGATAIASGMAGKALVLKVVIVVATLGGAAVGARLMWPEPSAEVSPPRALPAPVVAAPRPEPPVVEEEPSKVRQRAPRARVQKPEARAERLVLESRLLTEARAALRSGNSVEARRTLARLQSEFPAGVLRQEREVLTIEVLAAEGEHAEVAERVGAFVTAHPESPHAARLQKLVAGP